jgi:hypothetical protein
MEVTLLKIQIHWRRKRYGVWLVTSQRPNTEKVSKYKTFRASLHEFNAWDYDTCPEDATLLIV